MWFRGQAPGWNSSLRPVYPGYIRNLPINFRKNIVYKGFYTIHGASQMGLVVKNLPASSGDATGTRLIPGLGSFPWRRKWQSTPLQYSCLENPIEWGARRAIVHGVAKSRTQLRTSTFIHFHTIHGFRHPLGVFEYPLWIRKSHCIMMMIHNFTDEKTKKSYRKVAPDDRVNGWVMLNPGHLTVKPISYNKIQFKVIRSACRIVFCPWAMS